MDIISLHMNAYTRGCKVTSGGRFAPGCIFASECKYCTNTAQVELMVSQLVYLESI